MTRKFDLYKDGDFVGNYTLAQLSRKIAEVHSKILEAVAKEENIGPYWIVPAQTAENERAKKELLREWDEIRFRIKPSLRKSELVRGT